MKRTKFYNMLLSIGCFLMSLGMFSCSNSWNDYYSSKEEVSNDIEIYNGNIVDYISNQADLTQISSILKNGGIYDDIKTSGGYTFIVYTNDVMQGKLPADKFAFAKNCVSDISIDPSKLKDGFGISTRLGKNIWVSNHGNGDVYLDNYILQKKVKTANGYVYYVSGIVPILPSVYEFIESLGDDYSYFKSIVKRYEEVYFDKDNSTPIAVNAMGLTVYDSIMKVRNVLLDRYTENGLKSWDMFSEDYLTTIFIPSNDLINNAIATALEKLPIWVNRPVTATDKENFEKWVISACFVNRRLSQEIVAPTATEDFLCVDGYQQKIDLTQDIQKYVETDPAVWRPSVQIADSENPVPLSNGVAYFLKSFKIPNHVVIYRVKAKFYELWGAMTEQQQKQYFRWTNWTDPMIVMDCQTPFTLSETLPTMYYHELTAIPTAKARTDSLVCSVTYDGVLFNSSTGKLAEVNLPAGEYYLRMGFKHSLRYSIDIYFNDRLLVEDMLLNAQGSNFHFDRGSVSDMDYFGSSTIGYPEGFDWREWIEKDEKAVAYDTDGYQVAIVEIPQDGNFTITISSKDNAYLYSDVDGRTKNNVTQLMMYHWCLRPTPRNY